MSFARLVLSTSLREKPPRFTTNALPPRHSITHLIDHYLKNIHALYPFLPQTKLSRSINSVYEDDGRYVLPIDRWTVRLVLATSIASQSRRKGDTHYQDALRHATAALKETETVIHPGSIAGIQAILQLVLYAMLNPAHFNCWYLIGLASRAMVDLGLHQDPPQELLCKDSEIELRRCVYDCVYALDRSVLKLFFPKQRTESSRSISMVHVQGFSFTDDSASVPPPRLRIGTSGASQPSHRDLDPAVHLNHLRQIESYAYQVLFQSGRHILAQAWPVMAGSLEEIHRFSSTLPHNIKQSVRKLFRCEVLYGSIMILSPPGLTELDSHAKFLIFEYAVEFAELMYSFNGELEADFAFYTSHDMLRASYVAKRLIDILMNDYPLIFSGKIPEAPTPSGPTMIPCRTVDEMLKRAHNCLYFFDRTLEFLVLRFGREEESLNEFRVNSSCIRQSLEANYGTWSSTANTELDHYFMLGGSLNGTRA